MRETEELEFKSIENKTNDMIHPQPNYEMKIREKEKGTGEIDI